MPAGGSRAGVRRLGPGAGRRGGPAGPSGRQVTDHCHPHGPRRAVPHAPDARRVRSPAPGHARRTGRGPRAAQPMGGVGRRCSRQRARPVLVCHRPRVRRRCPPGHGGGAGRGGRRHLAGDHRRDRLVLGDGRDDRLGRGLLALALGRSDALDYGEKAVTLGQAVGDRPALSFAVTLHGSALAGVFGERERAIGLLEQAGTLLEAEGDEWSQALATLTRGVAALARPDPDRAQLLLRAAADRFARTGDALPSGAALRHLADLAVLRGRYDSAISALEEMLSILPAEDHPAGITRMAQLGCLYAFEGRADQSDHWHSRAETVAEDQQHLHMRVLACNARGLSLRRLGRLGEAEQRHRRAVELCRERNVPEGLAMAHVSLGYLAELHGDADAAERHSRASLRAACEVADRQAQAAALDGLAGAVSLRGDAGATGRLRGAASALREGTVGTVIGQGTAMRETIIGRLHTADRAGAGRPAARIGDRAAFDAAYAKGLRDPLAVLRAAST